MSFFLHFTVASVAVIQHPSPLEKQDVTIKDLADLDFGTHRGARRLEEINCIPAVSTLIQDLFTSHHYGVLYRQNDETCHCEQVLALDGYSCTSPYGTSSSTLRTLCPKTCGSQDLPTLMSSSSCDDSSLSMGQCLLRNCVWYMSNRTSDNPTKSYSGRCYNFNYCPIWMWGKGSPGGSTWYDWCQSSEGVSSYAVGTETVPTCEAVRAAHHLPLNFDSHEGPCISKTKGLIDTLDEQILGQTLIEGDHVSTGESYCKVHACFTRLNAYNCTCTEMISYFDDQGRPNPCDARMVEDKVTCLGTLFDQCPLSCQMYTGQLSKWQHHQLTEVGKLKTNVGKLLGIVLYPFVILSAQFLRALVSATAPVIMLNEYLWCHDCTY